VGQQPPSWDPYGQQQPRRQQAQPSYPPRQPYGQQQPRNPSGQPDPGQWQWQPSWPDRAYQGRPYGQQPRHLSFAPGPQYGTLPRQPAYQGQPAYPPQSYGPSPYPQAQPPYGQQPHPLQGRRQSSYQEVPRKRRRVFLWVFLGIQALFVIWIIAGVATVHTGPTPAQLAPGCYNHHWWPLFKSQADCVQHYGGALNDAGTAGKAIGAGLIVAFWMVVDVILGISYGIYKLARRSA
jgi:hypothetical protein